MLVFDSVTYGYKRRHPVVESFSWAVPGGRTVLLGPNGAGKSTLLGLGATAWRPWAGQVRWVDSATPAGNHVDTLRRRVAWMPQRIIAVPGMKCHEQVAYYGWLAGMRKRAAWESAASCIYAVGLSDRTNDKATQLSGGQLRRLGLAQALVAQPHLLLLDEPTAGLDPAQRIRFRGLLENLVEQREVSVVVSTHQVDDLSHTFDRVVVLDRGRLIFEGSVEQFLAHSPAASEGRSQPERAYAALVDGDD